MCDLLCLALIGLGAPGLWMTYFAARGTAKAFGLLPRESTSIGADDPVVVVSLVTAWVISVVEIVVAASRGCPVYADHVIGLALIGFGAPGLWMTYFLGRGTAKVLGLLPRESTSIGYDPVVLVSLVTAWEISVVVLVVAAVQGVPCGC